MMNEKKKKKMPLFLKILLVILGIIAVAVLAAYIWLRANFDKILDSKFESSISKEDHIGADVPAFEVETPDGTIITPDTLLEGKELAAIVLYASWCGPCKREFPEMNEVYQKYQDKMGMVGIDVDSSDTMESVLKYGEEHNLSFPLAYGADNESLDFMTSTTYPTTIIIDRNGKVCLWRIGSIPSGENFEEIVTAFMGDDYTEKHVALYTFAGPAKGAEFTVTTKNGTETYVAGEDGSCTLFVDDRDDITIKVISVPEGYSITDSGEIKVNPAASIVKLPITIDE